MAAGDIEIYGPYDANDPTEIQAGLSGNVVVADDITVHVEKGSVYYTVIKAA